MQEVTQELQNVDLSNPNALKEFMNRKIDEIDGNFQDNYSEVLDDDETTKWGWNSSLHRAVSGRDHVETCNHAKRIWGI